MSELYNTWVAIALFEIPIRQSSGFTIMSRYHDQTLATTIVIPKTIDLGFIKTNDIVFSINLL